MQKILIIDDDPGVRDQVVKILQYEGFHPINADNGRIGIELARAHGPDLILCDVVMPELNGYGVLVEIRADPLTADIPFIFLTGKTAQEDVRQGMKFGADDYLTKPFNAEDLIAAIHSRLARHATTSKQMDTLRLNLSRALPHELRTPLNTILGFTELLTNSHRASLPAMDDILEIQRVIHASGLRLQRLIENYLLYANLRLLTYEPEKRSKWLQSETMDARMIITHVVSQATEKRRRQDDVMLSLVAATVLISEGHLGKITAELLDNALQFSKPGTPVNVASTISGQEFLLTIADQGCGMAEEYIANLGAYMQFERQYHEQQGSGLGLTIARMLAQLYGGELTIASAPHKGTMVMVTLRMAERGTT